MPPRRLPAGLDQEPFETGKLVLLLCEHLIEPFPMELEIPVNEARILSREDRTSLFRRHPVESQHVARPRARVGRLHVPIWGLSKA